MSVTGPFSRDSGPLPNSTIDVGWNTAQWYRQSKPYVLRLAFYSEHAKKTYPEAYPWMGGAGASSSSLRYYVSPVASRCLNKAYEKFKERAGVAAQLAVDYAERQSSIDMIAKRSSQLLSFAKNVRSFNWPAAARDLGLRVRSSTRTSVRLVNVRGGGLSRSPLPVGRRRPIRHPNGDYEVFFKRKATEFGNNYLEFHFGWEPLMQSIGDAVEVLQGPCFKGQSSLIKGRASDRDKIVEEPHYGVPRFSTYNRYGSKVSYQLIAQMVVTDPNLYRANQLGFLNPAVIAWELVPFSFVVDWFANVGTFLGSFTDFVGVSLNNAATTQHAILQRKFWYRADWTEFHCLAQYDHIRTERSLGIATPGLVLKPPKWPSVTRGLTAVSLLTKFLR